MNNNESDNNGQLEIPSEESPVVPVEILPENTTEDKLTQEAEINPFSGLTEETETDDVTAENGENQSEEEKPEIPDNTFTQIAGEGMVFEDFDTGAHREPAKAPDDEDIPAEKPKKKRNKRAIAKFFYAVTCIFACLIGIGYSVMNGLFDKVHNPGPSTSDHKKPNSDNTVDIDDEPVYDDEDYELFQAVSSASSLNDYVYQWYNSGESLNSKNIVNVLLIGLDSKDGLENGGRSDTMMLISLNRKTQKIKMVSFYRDTWAYYTDGNGTGYYGKMNGSYLQDGPEGTVRTIENMFKISIDHYVCVDFSSFKALVNAVGGVRVDVQEYEAKNMYREWQIEVDWGEDILLDGKQALYFARQRHCDADADVSRTRRQRQVITAFIDSCKGASLSQLTEALDTVLKYVSTDMTRSEILSYAAKAVTYGWANYEIDSVKITDPEVFQTPTVGGQSIVVQDYPVVAQIVQNAIYGETNVVSSNISAFSMY